MDMWNSFCYFNRCRSVLLVLLAFHLVWFHHRLDDFRITSFTTALGQNYSCAAYKMGRNNRSAWEPFLRWETELGMTMWFNFRRYKILGLLTGLHCAVLPECLGFLSTGMKLTKRQNAMLLSVLRFLSSGTWWGRWNELECFQTCERDATDLCHW